MDILNDIFSYIELAIVAAILTLRAIGIIRY
jgi:hypothetical protein